MFRLIGLAEEAGTGIPAILRAWRELGYRFPEFQSLTERYEFTLTLRYIHMISEADRNWLEALGGGWSESEQLALVMARHEETIDNERLRGLAGLHPADATKVLVGLRDAGGLTMEGRRRGARYRLSDKALALIYDPGLGDSEPRLGDSESRLGDSGARLGDSEPSLGDSEPSLGNLPSRLRGFTPQFTEIIYPLLGRARVPTPERDAVVLRLCAVTPLSTREIATLLERSLETARTTVRTLVAGGKLRQIHMEPSHPHQRYRTVSPPDQS